MERTVLTAPEGQYYTDGATYGKEIYLAEDRDASEFYLIDESEGQAFEDASEEDYKNALERLGVHE
ncbi:MAG: hypothetical protein IJ367_02880 [Clostridia bacterium]|nr:hypothetical protein [Clostridia bacterium]